MIRFKKSIGVAAVLGSLLMVGVTATPALAASRLCQYLENDIVGTSTSTYASTSKNGNPYCGDAGVRALYTTYSGSPVYYTSWKYGSTYVYSSPGNTVVGGQHDVTSPAPAYAANFPFSS